MKYKDEVFEEYWNRRIKYKHPEEATFIKLAKKMFSVGWDKGRFELLREQEESLKR